LSYEHPIVGYLYDQHILSLLPSIFSGVSYVILGIPLILL